VAAATPEETARAATPRDRILETAFRLFYAHGIRGVGVDAVIAESMVAKATLYKHFRRKDDLVLAYLDNVDLAWRAQLEAASEAAGPDPRDRLVGMFDALKRPAVRTASAAVPSSTLPRRPSRAARCTLARSSTRQRCEHGYASWPTAPEHRTPTDSRGR
jgi:AcrR family transcriptional regulator